MKGVANHADPWSCVGHREVSGEALAGESIGQPLSRESRFNLGCRRRIGRGRQYGRTRYREVRTNPADFSRVLPYSHISDTYNHMKKTTLNIDDTVMAELKREAARQGRTMSEMVESALRLLLRSQRKRGRIPALPTFRSGGAVVDVADRDALYQAMEGR